VAVIKVLINGRSVCSVPPTEQGKREWPVCSLEICKGNKKGRIFYVQSTKCIPKILPFNTLNNVKVSIRTSTVALHIMHFSRKMHLHIS
jgi:hypothetical protein